MAEADFIGLWQEALKQLKTSFQEKGKDQGFSIWFENLNFIKYEAGAIVVAVKSNFVRDQLRENGCAGLLQDKLCELLGRKITLEFQVEARASAPASAQDGPATEKAAPEAQKKHPQLREEYTFETFVPGGNNAFAYNAALAVSKNPGKTYNPLLLYGGVGMGKTHLMQAVGNAIYSRDGGKVIYINAENFTNEFTSALRTQTIPAFTSKYRKADVLLLDDIHFLQGKPDTQEQVYNTFEALYNSYKQLIFVCDRPVSELKEMSDRLLNRFQRGLNISLSLPSYETRVAIIESKLKIINKTIPKDVINLIARNVETNIRDLESSLTKLLAYADLIQKDITLEIAQELLRDTFSSPKAGNISVEQIQKTVADYFNISFLDIKGKKHTKSVSLPRQIAIYLAHKLTEYSFSELGGEFGGRDHTTIMYSYNKIDEALHSDSALNSTILALDQRIKDKKS